MKSEKQRERRDFAVMLMLAAILSSLANLVSALLDIGRAARWWP